MADINRTLEVHGTRYLDEIDTTGLQIPDHMIIVNPYETGGTYRLIYSCDIDWMRSELSNGPRVTTWSHGEDQGYQQYSYPKPDSTSWISGVVRESEEVVDILNYLLGEVIFLDWFVENWNERGLQPPKANVFTWIATHEVSVYDEETGLSHNEVQHYIIGATMNNSDMEHGGQTMPSNILKVILRPENAVSEWNEHPIKPGDSNAVGVIIDDFGDGADCNPENDVYVLCMASDVDETGVTISSSSSNVVNGSVKQYTDISAEQIASGYASAFLVIIYGISTCTDANYGRYGTYDFVSSFARSTRNFEDVYRTSVVDPRESSGGININISKTAEFGGANWSATFQVSKIGNEAARLYFENVSNRGGKIGEIRNPLGGSMVSNYEWTTKISVPTTESERAQAKYKIIHYASYDVAHYDAAQSDPLKKSNIWPHFFIRIGDRNENDVFEAFSNNNIGGNSGIIQDGVFGTIKYEDGEYYYIPPLASKLFPGVTNLTSDNNVTITIGCIWYYAYEDNTTKRYVEPCYSEMQVTLQPMLTNRIRFYDGLSMVYNQANDTMQQITKQTMWLDHVLARTTTSKDNGIYYYDNNVNGTSIGIPSSMKWRNAKGDEFPCDFAIVERTYDDLNAALQDNTTNITDFFGQVARTIYTQDVKVDLLGVIRPTSMPGLVVGNTVEEADYQQPSFLVESNGSYKLPDGFYMTFEEAGLGDNATNDENGSSRISNEYLQYTLEKLPNVAMSNNAGITYTISGPGFSRSSSVWDRENRVFNDEENHTGLHDADNEYYYYVFHLSQDEQPTFNAETNPYNNIFTECHGLYIIKMKRSTKLSASLEFKSGKVVPYVGYNSESNQDETMTIQSLVRNKLFFHHFMTTVSIENNDKLYGTHQWSLAGQGDDSSSLAWNSNIEAGTFHIYNIGDTYDGNEITKYVSHSKATQEDPESDGPFLLVDGLLMKSNGNLVPMNTDFVALTLTLTIGNDEKYKRSYAQGMLTIYKRQYDMAFVAAWGAAAAITDIYASTTWDITPANGQKNTIMVISDEIGSLPNTMYDVRDNDEINWGDFAKGLLLDMTYRDSNNVDHVYPITPSGTILANYYAGDGEPTPGNLTKTKFYTPSTGRSLGVVPKMTDSTETYDVTLPATPVHSAATFRLNLIKSN